MKDDNYLKLMQARRVAKAQAEPYQEENSRKYTKIPTGVYEELMETTRQILLEELKD